MEIIIWDCFLDATSSILYIEIILNFKDGVIYEKDKNYLYAWTCDGQ